MTETVRIGCFIFGVAGGLLVLICSFTAKRLDVPRWTLILMALLGAFGALWGGLGLITSYYSVYLPSGVVHILDRNHVLCAGIAIGLFLALWLSGQLNLFSKKASEFRKQKLGSRAS